MRMLGHDIEPIVEHGWLSGLRLAISDDVKRRLFGIGHENPPKSIDVTEDELATALKHWTETAKRSGFAETSEHIMDKVVSHLAWSKHVESLSDGPQDVPFPHDMLKVRRVETLFATFQRLLNDDIAGYRDATNAKAEEIKALATQSMALSRELNQQAADETNALFTKMTFEATTDHEQIQQQFAALWKFLKRAAWTGAAILGILLLLALFSLRAHAQYSHINYIQFQNAGVNVTGGFFSYPFNFNFVGCTGATSGSTMTLTCTPGGSGTVTQVNPATGAGTITNLGTFGFSSQTTTPTLTIGLTNAGAHKFFGNNTGSAAAPNYLQLACADLSDSGTACTTVAPANTTSTSHQFFTAYTAASGAFTKAQPSCSDLSDAGTGCTGSTSSGGTVTSIATTSPITGGTITGTGTIACATCVTYGTPATGIARSTTGSQAIAGTELSGDATTSGSNAVTVVKVNGASVPASAAILASNSSNQLIAATTTGSGTTAVLSSAPTLTNPVVGTQTAFDNSTKAASTAYVDAQTKPVFSTAATGLQMSTSGNTAIAAAVTMTTPSSDSTYRFSFQVMETTAGNTGTCSTGTVSVYLQYTDADTGVAYATQTSPVNGNSISGGGVNTGFQMTTGAPGAANNFIALSREFRAKASVAVNYRVYQVTASNCTNPPIFTIRPVLYGPLGY